MSKISVYNKIVMKNKKKRKYGNQRNLYINLHLTEDFRMEFTAGLGELMPEGALTPKTGGGLLF